MAFNILNNWNWPEEGIYGCCPFLGEAFCQKWVLQETKMKTYFVLLNSLSSSSLSLSDSSTGSMVLSPSALSMLPIWFGSSSSSLESYTVACLKGREEAIEALEAGVDAWLDAADLPIADFFRDWGKDLVDVFFKAFFLDWWFIMADVWKVLLVFSFIEKKYNCWVSFFALLKPMGIPIPMTFTSHLNLYTEAEGLRCP